MRIFLERITLTVVNMFCRPNTRPAPLLLLSRPSRCPALLLTRLNPANPSPKPSATPLGDARRRRGYGRPGEHPLVPVRRHPGPRARLLRDLDLLLAQEEGPEGPLPGRPQAFHLQPPRRQRRRERRACPPVVEGRAEGQQGQAQWQRRRHAGAVVAEGFEEAVAEIQQLMRGQGPGRTNGPGWPGQGLRA